MVCIGGAMVSNGGDNGGGKTTDLFESCCRLYGRGDGWRPDLLVHPCQQWVPEQRWGNTNCGLKNYYADTPVYLMPEWVLMKAPSGLCSRREDQKILLALLLIC